MKKKIVIALTFLIASLNSVAFAASNDTIYINYLNDSNVTLTFPYILDKKSPTDPVSIPTNTIKPYSQVEVKVSTAKPFDVFPLLTNYKGQFEVNLECFRFLLSDHEPFISSISVQPACGVSVNVVKKSGAIYNVIISPKTK